jgi:hypothetical protein
MIDSEEKLLEYIQKGEHENQDFKFAINDSKKIALSLSAFANTSGGRLLIGVKDNGKITGIRPEEEKHMIEGAADLYCDPRPEILFTLIKTTNRKEVLVAEVLESNSKPVKAITPEGIWKAYIRLGDENALASVLHLKHWEQAKQLKGRVKPSQFTETDLKILKKIGEEPIWNLNSLVKKTGLTRRLALNILSNFLHWDLIELIRLDSEFKIRLKED